ncbi:HIT family protein [Parvularcula maris]|uniref:HIT family protein n=1 Tax=Parvularcula maris TaxID=2965077 RepID=A0A9X2L9U8_9PROT|nr:HIT family protein [Parvularcula maris]MCQ8185697.1 HIT family protein [Parvularcula maris]
MSLNQSYDDDNVFAKIIRGELPKVTVHEDDHILIFMDVFPQSEGHMLVISKMAKSVNITDIDPEELSRLIGGVQLASQAAVKALDPDGIRVVQFNGEPAGQTVFHTHFHVIPVYKDQGMKPHGAEAAPTDRLEAMAERIRNGLS